MKSLVSPIASFCLAATALLCSSQAQVSPIRIRVEPSAKSDTNSYKTVQSRLLNITLSNASAEQVDVKVKFAIFGRDVKTQDIVTLEQGELPATVKPHGNEKVQTPEARTAAEDARIGSKGKSEASGYKIIGQGVQVLKGDAVVAEYFEPASMKESFGKAPPAAKPEKKKK